MKLRSVFESYEAPDPSNLELSIASQKFKALVERGTLFHSTKVENAEAILKEGFRGLTYFSFDRPNLMTGKPGWAVLKVSGNSISADVYPDPEHMYSSPWISELMTIKGWSDITFERVTKLIPKKVLPWIFFEIKRKLTPGFWLVCDNDIKADLIERA